MEPWAADQLVTVTDANRTFDAIVYDRPSELKVVVAVVDRKRGPVFRTVHPETLTARDEAGEHDAALKSLIRRTPATSRGGQSASGASVQGRQGHGRSTMHRTTGK